MLISCGCGCGKILEDRDSRGRLRRMLLGHNVRITKPHLFLTKKSIEKIRAYNIGKKYGEKTKEKHRKNMSGRKNHRWKGGRYIQVAGYICLWKPKHPHADVNGYIFEHRFVMEKKLKRYLKRKEIVHHINHIKDDNRVENLMLFASQGDHMRHEYAERRWHE